MGKLIKHLKPHGKNAINYFKNGKIDKKL